MVMSECQQLTPGAAGGSGTLVESPAPVAKSLIFTADRGDGGRRLDLALARRLAGEARESRSTLQRWVRAGRVSVNGERVERVARRLAVGDAVAVALPAAPQKERSPLSAQPLELAILYEDDELLAINKPPGLLVHPTAREREDTLLNGLLWRRREASAGSGHHLGLVHRLDRGTSGVLLVAKSRAMHAALATAFARRRMQKEYLAVVVGEPQRPWGRIAVPIGRAPEGGRMCAAGDAGRPAETLWRLLAATAAPPLALLWCRPLTGRTHQIRVHLAAAGLPLLGDGLYGREPRGPSHAPAEWFGAAFARPALHAWRITFRDPRDGRDRSITAPLAPDLGELLVAAGLHNESAGPHQFFSLPFEELS
jgi:23S rRNA pseudouridine1911/1915/1917 synthase